MLCRGDNNRFSDGNTKTMIIKLMDTEFYKIYSIESLFVIFCCVGPLMETMDLRDFVELVRLGSQRLPKNAPLTWLTIIHIYLKYTNVITTLNYYYLFPRAFPLKRCDVSGFGTASRVLAYTALRDSRFWMLWLTFSFIPSVSFTWFCGIRVGSRDYCLMPTHGFRVPDSGASKEVQDRRF